MISTKETRRPKSRFRSSREQKLEDVVRLTYETMVGKTARINEVSAEDASPPMSQRAEQSWDEMVFHHRNKDYGAYVVRRRYVNNLTIGLIVTLILVMIVISYPTISKWFGSGDVTLKAPRKKVVYSELSAPPPIDKPRAIPPNIQLPRLQKVVKFVPPKVVKQSVAEVLPTIHEIRGNETGKEAVEASAEVIFDEPVAEVVVEDNELFTVVDQQPEFEGGYAAMLAFIKQNMQYPANARRMQIEGTVHVTFIVSKTGAISEVKVLRGIMTECDREAMRVVQLMPPWKPGKQNGRSVNVRFILPLKFRLN